MTLSSRELMCANGIAKVFRWVFDARTRLRARVAAAAAAGKCRMQCNFPHRTTLTMFLLFLFYRFSSFEKSCSFERATNSFGESRKHETNKIRKDAHSTYHS